MSDAQMDLTPRRIVEELDRYIVGQGEAKRAVAIAIRNRLRRQRLSGEIGRDILPKNLILIGPTGVGKTEIARRIAHLIDAPFVKVEATKFTEVGYVGRDVESMVRDLVEASVNLVRAESAREVEARAASSVHERVLEALLEGAGDAGVDGAGGPPAPPGVAGAGPGIEADAVHARAAQDGDPEPDAVGITGAPSVAGFAWERAEGAGQGLASADARTPRERLLEQLRAGRLEERTIEVQVEQRAASGVDVIGPQGVEHMGFDFQGIFERIMPARKKTRRMTVGEARRTLMAEECDRLIDKDKLQREAIHRAETSGVIFLDEIDKICAPRGPRGAGPDVSREGVQRDLLPIVEGSTVNTRHGPVRTDHVLFIAAGAFHSARPSDLIPELQGRFPIRVALNPLGRQDFLRILREPKNALTKQYAALLRVDGVEVVFEDLALAEIARVAEEVNERTQNIGARRLHTIFEKLLEDPLYAAPDALAGRLVVDRAYVERKLAEVRAEARGERGDGRE